MGKKKDTVSNRRDELENFGHRVLVERIFNGVRTPILALSLAERGPPRIVDCNDEALKLIGYEKAEVVDKSVALLDPEGNEEGDFWQPLREAGKQNFDIVGREIRRKDGTVFMSELKVSPLLNKSGVQMGAITVLNDLTRKHKMEDRRIRYEDRIVALHRHSLQLSTVSTREAIVDLTLAAIQETFSVHNIDFNVVNRSSVRTVKSLGARPKDAVIQLARNGPGIIVRAANTGITQVVSDTRNDPAFVDARVFDEKDSVRILSELSTPVLVDGEVVAVLNIESETLNAFSVEDQRYLEMIAFQVGAALKRVKYEEKLTALHTHALKLNFATSVEEIAKYTLDAMEYALGFDYSDVRFVDQGWLRLQGSRGMQVVNADLPLDGPGLTVKAANSRTTVRVADTRKESSYVDRIHDKGSKSPPTMLSELAVPVVIADRAAAILNVESTRPDAVTDSDQRLLELLSAHVASAMMRIALTH